MPVVNYRGIEHQLSTLLGLEQRPVAIAFVDNPPAGVQKFTGSEPSGCSFWRLAAGGRTFYTTPSDHYNCPIGSYTHNIDLPAERAQELNQTLSLMSEIGYIRMEEVPSIPRVSRQPKTIVFAPLGDTPIDPDVVIVSGRPDIVMLLQEAALRAGVTSQVPLWGRPTCMAIPAVMDGGAVASTGCVGNRVYTDLGADQMYVAVSGGDVARVAEQAGTIASANTTLMDYHRQRRLTLTQ
jgi:uncharacterized protein (DUF169 family)